METLLSTKLYPAPPPSRYIQRPRLLARLRVPCPLILLSAPAGFGKTSLVSEWTANCGQPIAWLSLDEGDSDPSRFLTYLIAALQTIAPDLGHEALGLLRS